MEKFGSKYGTSFQNKIISALLGDRSFLRQVFDILKSEYFDSDASEWLVREIMSYVDEYEKLPTLDVLKVRINTIDRDVLKISVVDTLKFAWNHLESDDLQYVKEQTIDIDDIKAKATPVDI